MYSAVGLVVICSALLRNATRRREAMLLAVQEVSERKPAKVVRDFLQYLQTGGGMADGFFEIMS
jgi:hypothetical protein